LEARWRSGSLPAPVYTALTRDCAQSQVASEETRVSEATRVTTDRDQPTRVVPAPDVTRSAQSPGGPHATGHTAPSTTPLPQSPPARVGEGSVLKDRFILESFGRQRRLWVRYNKARDLRKEEAQDREPYVAIKVLNEDFRQHPDALLTLQVRPKKTQRLAHPNIVTVYDFDRDGDTVFMTMEYLQGESLDRVIKRQQPRGLPKTQAMHIVEDMALGLAYAHKSGIVHADFKPGNVFVTQDGTVKVLDFGIARAAKRTGRRVQEATVFDPGALGALTPAYASCEMLEGGEPDPATMCTHWRCVAYELLAGHHPFNKSPAIRPAPIG